MCKKTKLTKTYGDIKLVMGARTSPDYSSSLWRHFGESKSERVGGDARSAAREFNFCLGREKPPSWPINADQFQQRRNNILEGLLSPTRLGYRGFFNLRATSFILTKSPLTPSLNTKSRPGPSCAGASDIAKHSTGPRDGCWPGLPRPVSKSEGSRIEFARAA